MRDVMKRLFGIDRTFERNTFANKLFLTKKVFSFGNGGGHDCRSAYSTNEKIYRSVSCTRCSSGWGRQVVTLLGNLPQTYSTLVTVLTWGDELTVGYVQQALMHEEQSQTWPKTFQLTGNCLVTCCACMAHFTVAKLWLCLNCGFFPA